MENEEFLKLWARARANSEDDCAWNQLIESIDESLRRLIRALINAWRLDRDVGSVDVAQSSYRVLLEKTPEFESFGHFVGWMRTVARNRLTNLVRRRAKIVDFPSTELADSGETPSKMLMAKEDKDLVQFVVDEMPEDLRQVCKLHYVDGLSWKECAVRIGRNEQAARAMGVRCNRHFQEARQRLGLAETESDQ